jgi:hypothetical protein
MKDEGGKMKDEVEQEKAMTRKVSSCCSLSFFIFHPLSFILKNRINPLPRCLTLIPFK